MLSFIAAFSLSLNVCVCVHEIVYACMLSWRGVMCVCVCLFSELVSITRLRANNYIHEIQEIAKLLCMCVCMCV